MAESTILPGLRVVGLLGGVGSGKSTVARVLAEGVTPSARATILDADAAVSRQFEDPAVLGAIETALGTGLRQTNGQLDRQALAKRIFGDENARKSLEAILHPAVRQEFHRELTALEASGDAAWAFLDVPLLLENGMDAVCDHLVYVAAPAATRSARACARHGWTHDEWLAREAVQRPVEEKEAAADAIVENLGTVAPSVGELSGQLETILRLPPRSMSERWPQWNRLPASRFPSPSKPSDG